MAALDCVKKWMTFIGWTEGGGPGGVKTEYGGTVIARHGDATWIKDVQDSCDRDVADKPRAELERREVLRASPSWQYQNPYAIGLEDD